MKILQELDNLLEEAKKDIETIKTTEQLEEFRLQFFGRKTGKLTLILRGLSELSAEERPQVGKHANIVKSKIEGFLEEKAQDIQNERLASLKDEEWIDNTVPGKTFSTGSFHPITQFIEEVYDVFGRMGFDIADGPDIETEFYNFTALNIPPDHPAREMQDTFFLENVDGYVLRTQTSSVQIRYMEKNRPPFRIIAPGKTYRKDSDATHSPMFHQFEGLMVDKNISIANLRAVLMNALSELLHHKVDVRFRTSYFPFVEPGLEVDVSCVICDGCGKNSDGSICRVCKGSGWLEMGGAGSVHPQVLKNVNIDPHEYTGFAFGFGVERLIMIKYKIDDLRLFFENDLRFLKQF